MKHYLEAGDIVEVVVDTKVKYNGHDGFTINDSENVLGDPRVLVKGQYKRCIWDENGYYWQD